MSGLLYTLGGTVPFIMWGCVSFGRAMPRLNFAYSHCLIMSCICMMFLAICLVGLEYVLNKSSVVVFSSGSLCIAEHILLVHVFGFRLFGRTLCILCLYTCFCSGNMSEKIKFMFLFQHYFTRGQDIQIKNHSFSNPNHGFGNPNHG